MDRDQLDALLLASPDALLVVDEAGVIVAANEEASTVLACPVDALEGSLIEDFVPEESRVTHADHRREFMRGAGRRPMGLGRNLVARRADGSTVPVEIALNPFHLGGQKLVSAALRDVSVQRAAFDALRRKEETFRVFLDEAPDAVFLVSSVGWIQHLNRRAAELFGYSADELANQPVEVLIPEEAREAHRLSRTRFLADLRPFSIGQDREILGLRKDGETFPISVQVTPLQTEDGLVLAVEVRDLTEARHARRTIDLLAHMAAASNQANDLREALIEMVREVGVYTGWDLGHVYLRSPEVAGRFLPSSIWYPEEAGGFEALRQAVQAAPLDIDGGGREGGPFLGRALRERVPILLEDLERHPLQRREALCAAGLRSGLAVPILMGDEVCAVVEFFSLKPQAENPDLLEVLAAIGRQVGRVAERERSAHALLAHATELTRSNRELERFAYIASHDLQEPLRMVSNYTLLLERRYRDVLDEKATKFLGYAREGAMRMQALLEDLLEVSRVQRARLEVEEVDLAVVLADLMVALNPMLEEAGVRLESDPLPVVMGSRDFLSKTLRHLIENGVKFRRGEDPWVRISADKGRSEWRLCVEDNGIGIAPEFHERVMQAFQRLHVRHEYAGNGVGLALCRQIIEMHGGRIWIESALGEGAAVHFTLPFEVRAAEPRGLGAPSTPPPPEA